MYSSYYCQLVSSIISALIGEFLVSRMSWLREVNADAEKLFCLVAEVFFFWAKSHVSTLTHLISNCVHVAQAVKDCVSYTKITLHFIHWTFNVMHH